MKICSLLASGENGGKIWNLFKPAVVTSSRQVYQRMKVSQLVAYICRMRPHYRKYIFVDRPRRTFFLLFKHLPNRVLHDVPWILFLLLLLLFYWTTTRLYRNTNPLIQREYDYSTRFHIEQHFSNFEAIYFRNNICNIKKFCFLICFLFGLDRFEDWHETVSVDRSITFELVDAWMCIGDRPITRLMTNVFCPVDHQFPLIFNFLCFLSQTLIEHSLFPNS